MYRQHQHAAISVDRGLCVVGLAIFGTLVLARDTAVGIRQIGLTIVVWNGARRNWPTPATATFTVLFEFFLPQ